MTDLVIRPAELSDAEAAAEVLRRSITELCHVDHRNIAAVLDGWLANKNAKTVAEWIADPSQSVLVAISDGQIAGVGAASALSRILLNYVNPAYRFKGASKALIVALEDYLRRSGCTVARLTSTGTAHRFYLAFGYEDDGPPQAWRGGAMVHPMKKPL